MEYQLIKNCNTFGPINESHLLYEWVHVSFINWWVTEYMVVFQIHCFILLILGPFIACYTVYVYSMLKAVFSYICTCPFHLTLMDSWFIVYHTTSSYFYNVSAITDINQGCLPVQWCTIPWSSKSVFDQTTWSHGLCC